MFLTNIEYGSLEPQAAVFFTYSPYLWVFQPEMPGHS